MRIDLDDDELWMLIEFNEQMARDALESGEINEAKERASRAKTLRILAKKVA